jgi:hypothetical protein
MKAASYAFVDSNGTLLRHVTESEFQAINAVGSHVAKQHTCMISKEGDSPKPIGSGTFVKIDGHLFIATAKHLFEGFAENDLIGIYWGEDDRRAGTTFSSVIVHRNLDLAAIPIPSEARACGGPIEGPEGLVQKGDTQIFVVSGVPAERIVVDPKKRTVEVGHFSLGCIELPPHLRPEDPFLPIRTDVDLFLNYTRKFALGRFGDPMRQIAPFGLSGGGIWLVAQDEGGIWSPDNARLVAIQSTVESRQWRYLRSTRIGPWIQMVQKYVGK